MWCSTQAGPLCPWSPPYPKHQVVDVELLLHLEDAGDEAAQDVPLPFQGADLSPLHPQVPLLGQQPQVVARGMGQGCLVQPQGAWSYTRPRVSQALSWAPEEPQDVCVAVGTKPPIAAITALGPIPVPHTWPQAMAPHTTPGPSPTHGLMPHPTHSPEPLTPTQGSDQLLPGLSQPHTHLPLGSSTQGCPHHGSAVPARGAPGQQGAL